MEYANAFLLRCDGQREPATIKEAVHGNVHAISICGESSVPLDGELGCIISLQPSAVTSWMADYRHCEFWCSPAFGCDLCQVPEQTQGLIWQKADGSFGVILPVVSQDYKCTLAGTQGGLQAQLYSWCDGLNYCNALAFLWAEGKDPFSLLQECAGVGSQLLEDRCPLRQQREYPDLFEYLGWCSWDAFEIRVSEDALLAKCQEFREKQIPVKWMILDDMWAEVHDFYGATYETRRDMIRLMHGSKLYDLCADPIRFPNGLAGCIQKINDYGIRCGVWYPTTGYWRGLEPEGPLAKKLKSCLMETQDGRLIHSPAYESAHTFYQAFNGYLADCGAEFVKIDNQSMSRRFFKQCGSVGQICRNFHDAMEDSVQEHFENRMINCMGMANEDMWNRRQSPISRCSDDFLPEDRAWFTKHILQCSYNCLIQGQFYFCDWDMWWTDDAQAVKNSILRAVSGGPIYVSDTLERSRREVLEPLILQDGRILRCDRPGMPTADCLTIDPRCSKKPFKLQNLCRGRGVLAVFNLDEQDAAVCGTLCPEDIPGLVGTEFAVYEHFSQTLHILKAGQALPVTLQNSDDYRLYIITALENGNAVIGDANKIISPAALTEQETLKEQGTLLRVENRMLVREEIL